MRNQAKYSAMELFEMFKEEHRLCSPLDPMADAAYELTPDSLICEWRAMRDLLEWEELPVYFNKRFRINISKSEWQLCFEPEDTRTIMDVCHIIASKAPRITYTKRKLLGQECLTASVFLGFKKNLLRNGVNVSDLHSYSLVEPYLVKYFDPMMEEVLLTGAKVFDELNYSVSRTLKPNPNWFDKIFRPSIRVVRIDTGSVKTFRDLVNRICESDKIFELVTD